MPRHQDQVVSALRRAVQSVLARGLNDPRVRGMVSVTNLRLSADGTEAVAFVSVLPADAGALSMHGLAHAAPHIHAEVAKLVRMRRVPALRFELDEGIKKEAAVLAAIKEGTQRDEDLRRQRQAPRPGEPSAPERGLSPNEDSPGRQDADPGDSVEVEGS